jgi:2-polyprenyl-3-methyl-5-hydroxy-6-metoxy-1,4-benzoquinol methylase
LSLADASAPGARPAAPCPICGEGEARRAFREQGVDLLRCRACGHVRSTWAADPDYAGYWGEGTSAEATLDATAHYWNEARLPVYREFLRRFAGQRGRLLDVGCGIGFFVKAARDAGWDAHGSEISPVAVRLGRERLDLSTLHAGRVEDAGFSPGSFDAITLWDVIEHVTDPVALLAGLRRLLRPGGLLFVQTPNVAFHLRRARALQLLRGGDESLNMLEVKDHLNDFTPRSLRLAAERAGFDRTQGLVLRPTYSLGGGRARAGVALKLAWYALARALFAASRGRVQISNTLHLAAWA